MAKHRERRRRFPSPDPAAVDPETGLLDQRSVERAAEAAVHAAGRGHFEVSLLLIAAPTAPGATPSEVAEVLAANLRSIDVLGRLDDGTFAIVLDAPAPGALRAAHRMKQVLADRYPARPVWAAVGTAGAGAGGWSELLFASTSAALGQARRDPWGWVEVVGGSGLRPIGSA